MLQIKNLALGLALVYGGSVAAKNQTYKVKAGDSISTIAERFHVKQRSLLSFNGLSEKHRLQIGMSISIPGKLVAAKPVAKKSSVSLKKIAKVSGSAGQYVVRDGDHDLVIAKKLGVSLQQLHVLNPNVQWKKLKVGQHISVRGGVSKASSKVATAKTAPAKAKSHLVVRDGDNDWIIARRLGIKPRELRLLNPGVKWTALRPGQILKAGKATVAAGQPAKRNGLGSRYAAINSASVVVRGGPSTSSRKVTQVPEGTRVTVLDREANWYKLRFPRGTEGWVRGDLLRPVSKPIVAEATPKGTKKSRIAKLAKKSRWVSMKPVRRKAAGGGYVAAIDLPEAGSNRIVERAESFAGVRYRYGQMSRSGTDCSGFTSQVYRGLGVKLPRSSRDQARVGVPVTGGKMKPGDLVFFRTTRANRISHVGIYVGANKFIHASSGGGRVQVSSLNDRYYHNRFVAARRMVKTKQQANEISRVVKNEPAPRAPGRVAAATQPNNEGIDANGVIQ